jgi:hypothetical protein
MIQETEIKRGISAALDDGDLWMGMDTPDVLQPSG